MSPKEVDSLITSLETRLQRGERIFETSGLVDPDWSKCATEVYALLDRLKTMQQVCPHEPTA